jgi:hypothetical protein
MERIMARTIPQPVATCQEKGQDRAMSKIATDVEEATRRWVERVVIGENLCPFARAVVPRMRVAVSAAESLEDLLGDVAAELQRLIDTAPPALSTTLIVTPAMLARFGDYLEALAVIERAITDAGLSGELQVASFHPRYRFADATSDDPANYTNRSPYPMFHLLREAEVSRAVDAHPDPDGIPARNVERMRALGEAGVRALLAGCFAVSLVLAGGCGGSQGEGEGGSRGRGSGPGRGSRRGSGLGRRSRDRTRPRR